MMKHLLILVTLTALLLQQFSKVIIVLGYEMNKKYITENLCENRSKPALHCDGHCHLQKQLDKEKSSQSPLQDEKDRSDVQFCEAAFSIAFNHPLRGMTLSFNDPCYFPQAPAFSIFQPPRC
jgi:hypothetical protein